MKIEPILKLASLSEEVCSEARDLTKPANDQFVDWLLVVSDQFGKYRDDVEADAEFFSVLNPLVVKIPSKLDIWQKDKNKLKYATFYGSDLASTGADRTWRHVALSKA